MSTVKQQSGIDIFGPETRIITNVAASNIAACVSDTEDSFLRACKFELPEGMKSLPLAEILRRTDHELQQVAVACGATVLAHTWGLYKPERVRSTRFGCYRPGERSYAAQTLGTGNILAAKVPVLRGYVELDDNTAKTFKPHFDQVTEGVARYDSGHCKNSDDFYQIRDMDNRQFMIHPETKDVVLVDIEPLWKVRQDYFEEPEIELPEAYSYAYDDYGSDSEGPSDLWDDPEN